MSPTPLSVLFVAAVLGLRQAPSTSPGEVPAITLPADVAARVNGQPISMAEYKDFLYQMVGKQQLREMIGVRLLEEEAAKEGITVPDAELQERLDQVWNQVLVQRHGGDRAKAEVELRQMGYTIEAYDRMQAFQFRKDLLLDKLAVRMRVVTDEMIRMRFQQRYGVDGVKVEVRQVFLTKATFMREEIARGKRAAEVDQTALEARARQKAFEVHERLKKGEAFDQVAREESHDPLAKTNGGLLANYNYDRFGDEFAQVVRRLEVNEISDPFPSPAGWHIVQVTSRSTTPLERVRDALHEELSKEPTHWGEKSELFKRILDQAEIVMW